MGVADKRPRPPGAGEDQARQVLVRIKKMLVSESKNSASAMSSMRLAEFLVGRDGFEPSYAMRTDLQSVSFNHSDTCPMLAQ